MKSNSHEIGILANWWSAFWQKTWIIAYQFTSHFYTTDELVELLLKWIANSDESLFSFQPIVPTVHIEARRNSFAVVWRYLLLQISKVGRNSEGLVWGTRVF